MLIHSTRLYSKTGYLWRFLVYKNKFDSDFVCRIQMMFSKEGLLRIFWLCWKIINNQIMFLFYQSCFLNFSKRGRNIDIVQSQLKAKAKSHGKFIAIFHEDRAKRHDLKSRLLVILFPFLFSPKKRGKWLAKIVILSHAFLLDCSCEQDISTTIAAMSRKKAMEKNGA